MHLDQCFNCGESASVLLSEKYGHSICKYCHSKLKLAQDKTIKKWISKSGKEGLEMELRDRLDFLEKDFLKKRIKLLHVLERIERLK